VTPKSTCRGIVQVATHKKDVDNGSVVCHCSEDAKDPCE
jgi:hypothetical protein